MSGKIEEEEERQPGEVEEEKIQQAKNQDKVNTKPN